MRNRIRDKYNELKDKKNKTGMNVLEFLVIMMMFIMILGFFFDSFMILNQHYVASREVNIVTRQIAMQGGVDNAEPEGYNRFGQDYATSLEIHQRVRERLDGVNVDNFNMFIDVHGEDPLVAGVMEFHPGSSIPIPYQESFELILQYEYRWFVMGQMIPGLDTPRTRTLQRSGVSELGGGS